MPHEWFNSKKVAQVAVYYSNKEGSKIPVLKLVKLIYLADRKHMQLTGFPITNDRFVSMPQGPVNSVAYNYINGEIADESWQQYMCQRSGNTVSAAARFEEEDLDELSDAEVETLSAVWDEFGGFDKWTIRNWTHDNCPEWQDPNGSMYDLPYERVYKFLGIEEPKEQAKMIHEEREIDSLFNSLRT